MRNAIYSSGDRVIVKANKREGRLAEEHGYFQEMIDAKTAVVAISRPILGEVAIVDMPVSQIKPFYDHPSDQTRRGRHAARLFKQGIRMFRLRSPRGDTFHVETVDVIAGIAVGRRLKRKTVQIVKLHELFPELR